MKTLLQIAIVLILLACGYLTLITFIGVMTGSDTGSLKFLIPIVIAVIFALVGLGYSGTQQGRSFLVGVIIPIICIGYAYHWNQSAISDQRKDKEDGVHATCSKVMDSKSPNGYGYYYVCENGEIVYSVK
jgi:hypothetical protein